MQGFKKIIFLFITLAGCLCSQLYAQNQAYIIGTVRDSTGAKIDGATVAIVGARNGTYSDPNGNYRLKVKAGKEQALSVSFVGYLTIVVAVPELSPDQEFKIDITLKRDAYNFDDIEVSSEKDRYKMGIITIDPKTSKTLPNVSGNFEAILKTFPGVSGGNELSSAYNVRGGNFDENLIYVNDIEVYRSQLVRSGQQEGLSFINGDLVSSIKFSAGGFEAKYGDKLSSVLDVTYIKPDSFIAGFRANFMGVNAYAGGTSKDKSLSYIIGARFRTNQYILNSLDVQGDYRPIFGDLQVFVNKSLDKNKRWNLGFLNNTSLNRFLILPQSQTTSFGTVTNALRLTVNFNGYELMNYQAMTNALTLEFSPDKFTSLKLIASHIIGSEREFFTVEGAYGLSQLDNDLGSETFGQVKFDRGNGYFINYARNQLDVNIFTLSHKGQHFRGKHTFYWGAEIRNERISDFIHEWQYNDSADYSVPFNTGDSIFLFNLIRGRANLNSYRISGYFQNSIFINPDKGMVLNYGIRTNYSTLNNQNVISPRAQFSYEPNKVHNLKTSEDSLKKKDIKLGASVGYYYQPPFYREMRNIEGRVNTNVKAQQSIHFVVGGDYNFIAWDRKFKFYSELYYKILDNMVPYQIENIRIRYYGTNSSRGYAAGWDMRINGEFVDGLESWFSFSLLKTDENIEYLDANNNVQNSGLIRRPTDQRVNASVFFQDELPMNPRLKTNLFFVFGSATPYYLGGRFRYVEGFKIPPYRRVDIGFTYDILDAKDPRNKKWKSKLSDLKLGLEIFNLTAANNTISYIWVRDFTGATYGVPSYLTTRRINITLSANF